MAPYWTRIPLDRMTRRQWEDLCDGCAKCCLVKLIDEDDERAARAAHGPDPTVYTSVACKLLDLETCQCSRYKERLRLVPGCVRLTPESLPQVVDWLPGTCAYRLLYEGKPLAWWHPLVSGDRETVHRAGVSLRGQMCSERDVPEEDLEDFTVPRRRVDHLP